MQGKTIFRTASSTAVVLMVIGCGPVLAQAPGGSDSKTDQKQSEPSARSERDKQKVSLTFDRVDLVSALRTLMKSVKVDYVIDDNLKEGTVTANLTEVAFIDALSTVMKVSTIPVQLEIKEDLYHFSRKPEPPEEKKAPEVKEPEKPAKQIEAIPLRHADAEKTRRALLGMPDPPPGTQYVYGNGNTSQGSFRYFGFNNGQVTSAGGSTNPNGGINRSGGTFNIGSLMNALSGYLNSRGKK